MSKRTEATRAGSISLTIHVAVIGLVLFVSAFKPVQIKLREVTPLFAPLPQPHLRIAKSGGGGGARQPLVPKGEPPKAAPRAFAPPAIVTHQASLTVPAIGADLPQIASAIGVPDGVAGLMAGPGINGIGGPGLGGFGPGPGRGPGGDGDDTSGVLRAGGAVSAPKPLFTPEPEYSEDARNAKLQGIVLISMVVDPSGRTTHIKVLRPLGLGLDEKAMEAVRRWMFAPGKKDGKPVAVAATAEVSFRLL